MRILPIVALLWLAIADAFGQGIAIRAQNNIFPTGAVSSASLLYTLPVTAGQGYYFKLGANESVWYNGTNTATNSSGGFVQSGFSKSFIANTNYIMVKTRLANQALTAGLYTLSNAVTLYSPTISGSFQIDSAGSTNDLGDPDVFGFSGSGLIMTHRGTNTVGQSLIIGGADNAIYSPLIDVGFGAGGDGAILFSAHSSMGCDAESVIIGGSGHHADYLSDSVIIGGQNNLCNLAASVVIGGFNMATGSVVCIGYSNTINQNGGVVVGAGLTNTANGSTMVGASGQYLLFTSSGWSWTGAPVGSGNGLTNAFRLGNGAGGITLATNSTAPANTTTIRAWVSVTNETGGVFKMPLYQ